MPNNKLKDKFKEKLKNVLKSDGLNLSSTIVLLFLVICMIVGHIWNIDSDLIVGNIFHSVAVFVIAAQMLYQFYDWLFGKEVKIEINHKQKEKNEDENVEAQ